ncbi:DUF3810 domain-containing protein [Chryseobacterium sp. A301]
MFYTLSQVSWANGVVHELFEWQKEGHQRLFNVFPFSLGDVLYILLGIYLFYLISKLFSKESRIQTFSRLLLLLNCLYLIYQIFWGQLYFQKPIYSDSELSEPTVTELKQLANEYLEKCVDLRNQVSEDSSGVFKITNLHSIQIEILSKQRVLPAFLPPKDPTNVLLFKPSLFGSLMSYTGILGYYNPFTAEAQYNAKLPNTTIPFTLAHESAHQLGYAREQEANFVGYLLGRDSKNLDLKYSTNYFVLRNLLWSLSSHDPKFVEEKIKMYSEGMRRDADAANKFNVEHEGISDDFFQWTNDLFLKSNQQEGRITYSYFLNLLVKYRSLEP